jgi:hypothetical protein
MWPLSIIHCFRSSQITAQTFAPRNTLLCGHLNPDWPSSYTANTIELLIITHTVQRVLSVSKIVEITLDSRLLITHLLGHKCEEYRNLLNLQSGSACISSARWAIRRRSRKRVSILRIRSPAAMIRPTLDHPSPPPRRRPRGLSTSPRRTSLLRDPPSSSTPRCPPPSMDPPRTRRRSRTTCRATPPRPSSLTRSTAVRRAWERRGELLGPGPGSRDWRGCTGGVLQGDTPWAAVCRRRGETTRSNHCRDSLDILEVCKKCYIHTYIE